MKKNELSSRALNLYLYKCVMILFSENIFFLLQRSLQIYFLEAYLTKGTLRLQTLHQAYNNQNICLNSIYSLIFMQKHQKWNVNKAIKIYFAFDKLQNLRN